MTTRKLYLAHVLARSASRVGDKLGWADVPPRSILLGWVETELKRRGIGLETDPLPAVQTKLWYLPAQAPFNSPASASLVVYRKVPGVTVPTSRSILPTEYTNTVTVKLFDDHPPSLLYQPPGQIKDQTIFEAIRARFAGMLVSNLIRPRWEHTLSAPAPLLLPQTDASDWPPPLPPGVDRYNNDRLNAAWRALPKHPEVAKLQAEYLALPPGKYGSPTLSNWNNQYFFLCGKLQENPTQAEAQKWLNTVLLPGLREMVPAKKAEAPLDGHVAKGWSPPVTSDQAEARKALISSVNTPSDLTASRVSDALERMGPTQGKATQALRGYIRVLENDGKLIPPAVQKLERQLNLEECDADECDDEDDMFSSPSWEAELTRLQEQFREADRTQTALHGRLKALGRAGKADKKSKAEYQALEQEMEVATDQYRAAEAAMKAHRAKRPT